MLQKAIILAGGTGSRLYPLTRVMSKQLQAVFDKPLIYYPLTVLMSAGIKNICLICSPEDISRYRELLGDGSQWGIFIEYRVQKSPGGIAQAFLIAEDFIDTDDVVLMLGDNIFSGGSDFLQAVNSFTSGATIFAYYVKDPMRYGVVEFDEKYKAISLEEKPNKPKSNYAVPGIYIYDKNVISFAKSLRPSARGELEITDINIEYMRRNLLQVNRLSRGFVWIDAGTSAALHDASSYVATVERRQGIKIGCPEEAALTRGFISLDKFTLLIKKMPACDYRDYLRQIANEWQR